MHTSIRLATAPLIDFARGVYSVPACKIFCLSLQNEMTVNVNVLLWSWWLDARTLYLDSRALPRCMELASRFSETYVQPLRNARYDAQDSVCLNDTERKSWVDAVVAAEVTAEIFLLTRLEALSDQLPLCVNNHVCSNYICPESYLAALDIRNFGALAQQLRETC